jgi:thymidylate synthase
VIQLFNAEDIATEHKDIPCTCTLQFFVRNELLELVTYMRSNDVYLGLPHDVFAFTMLQEIVATTLGIDVGSYRHAVGSLHLYDDDRPQALEFLREGWQSTQKPMPAMPRGDPRPSIQVMLTLEAGLREHGELNRELLSGLDPYWRDLITLLQFLWYVREQDFRGASSIASQIVSESYSMFVARRLRELKEIGTTLPEPGP